MLAYVKGCLLEAFAKHEVEAIAQGCNCQNTMKSGIAPQIARTYPEVREVDKQTVKGDRSKMGYFTQVNTRDGYVFNLYTQFGYWERRTGGRDLDYSAVRHALLLLNRFCKGKDIKVIGLPKIGAGLAGGDWKIIESIINETLTDVAVTIYVKD